MLHDSLMHILRDAREMDREIQFFDSEHDESKLSFSELWHEAVELLGDLHHRGMTSGDELIIFTKSNRKFVVAFWASILGGIVPVPVAVGISDEHRFKLFRILSQLRRGTLYTEPDLLERLMGFASSRKLADIAAQLRQHTILNNDHGPGNAGNTDSRATQSPGSPQHPRG